MAGGVRTRVTAFLLCSSLASIQPRPAAQLLLQISIPGAKAVFAYNATADGSVDVKLCTVAGLEEDTALVVVQGEEIYA